MPSPNLPYETISTINNTTPVDATNAHTPHNELLQNDINLDNNKIDKVLSAISGNIALLTNDGSVKDSGYKIDDYLLKVLGESNILTFNKDYTLSTTIDNSTIQEGVILNLRTDIEHSLPVAYNSLKELGIVPVLNGLHIGSNPANPAIYPAGGVEDGMNYANSGGHGSFRRRRSSNTYFIKKQYFTGLTTTIYMSVFNQGGFILHGCQYDIVRI